MSSVAENQVLISVKDLTKYFPVKKGVAGTVFRRPSLFVRAVDGVSFDLQRGEIFGIVGESGCGKTTTGRMLVGLLKPTSGEIAYHGQEISEFSTREMREYHRRVQIVFQDPYESLSPRLDVYSTISEPIRLHNLAENAEIEADMVAKALEEVELHPPEEFVGRLPHELSGGQRQRLAVARSLVLKPELIVADEPVSMLDVSIRAEVLNLLQGLREKSGISIVIITHDLAVARHMCDRVGIMYLGKLVEEGRASDVVFNSKHPYTKALIAAVPVPDPDVKAKALITGEVPSAISIPPGCRFHPRCPAYIGEICKTISPRLQDLGEVHEVACHLYPTKHETPITECCGPITLAPLVSQTRGRDRQ